MRATLAATVLMLASPAIAAEPTADQLDDRRKLGAVADNLGVLLMGEGRYAESETLLRQSLDFTPQVGGSLEQDLIKRGCSLEGEGL